MVPKCLHILRKLFVEHFWHRMKVTNIPMTERMMKRRLLRRGLGGKEKVRLIGKLFDRLCMRNMSVARERSHCISDHVS
jgi:hypothetical protein